MLKRERLHSLESVASDGNLAVRAARGAATSLALQQQHLKDAIATTPAPLLAGDPELVPQDVSAATSASAPMTMRANGGGSFRYRHAAESLDEAPAPHAIGLLAGPNASSRSSRSSTAKSSTRSSSPARRLAKMGSKIDRMLKRGRRAKSRSPTLQTDDTAFDEDGTDLTPRLIEYDFDQDEDYKQDDDDDDDAAAAADDDDDFDPGSMPDPASHGVRRSDSPRTRMFNRLDDLSALDIIEGDMQAEADHGVAGNPANGEPALSQRSSGKGVAADARKPQSGNNVDRDDDHDETLESGCGEEDGEDEDEEEDEEDEEDEEEEDAALEEGHSRRDVLAGARARQHDVVAAVQSPWQVAGAEAELKVLRYAAAGTIAVVLVSFIISPYTASSLAWVTLCGALMGLVWLKAPVAVGWIASQTITRFALFGYPLHIGTLSIVPWIHKGNLSLRISTTDVGFANPPRFPHKWFVYVGRLDFILSIPLRTLPRILLWRPLDIPLRKVPDFRCIAVVDVPYIDFESVSVNFELCEGRFNINELTKELAEREVISHLMFQHRKARFWEKLRLWTPAALLERARGHPKCPRFLRLDPALSTEATTPSTAAGPAAFGAPREPSKTEDNPAGSLGAARPAKQGSMRSINPFTSSTILAMPPPPMMVRSVTTACTAASSSVAAAAGQARPPLLDVGIAGTVSEMDLLPRATSQLVARVRVRRQRSYSFGDAKPAAASSAVVSESAVSSSPPPPPPLSVATSVSTSASSSSTTKGAGSAGKTKTLEGARRTSGPRLPWKRKTGPLHSAPISLADMSPDRARSPLAASGAAEPSSAAPKQQRRRRSKLAAPSSVAADEVIFPDLAEARETLRDVLPNKLQVTIIRARNLVPSERSLFAARSSTDPKVVVKVREHQAVSSTRYKTTKPMWQEMFEFPVSDPSAVLHISVLDEDFGQSDFLGQWVVTLKYLVVNPAYCWHEEKGFTVNREQNSIRGWFPLMSKKWARRGECGEIEMQVAWVHDPLYRNYVSPCRTALNYMDQNSRETNLRLGSRDRVMDMLNHVPVLFNIQRVTIRKISFFLQDLFRGSKGHAERLRKLGKSSDKASKIRIPSLEWSSSFRPRKGEPGITTFQVLYAFFIRGLIPKVFNQKIFGKALTQTASGFAYNFASSAQSFLRGEFDLKGIVHVGRKIGGEFRTYGRQMRKKFQSEQGQDTRVDAEDDDFLHAEALFEGVLEKSSISGSRNPAEVNLQGRFFRRCFFQLKAQNLYYTRLKHSEARKIPLASVQLVTLDLERRVIFLHRLGKLTALRALSATAHAKGPGKSSPTASVRTRASDGVLYEAVPPSLGEGTRVASDMDCGSENGNSGQWSGSSGGTASTPAQSIRSGRSTASRRLNRIADRYLKSRAKQTASSPDLDLAAARATALPPRPATEKSSTEDDRADGGDEDDEDEDGSGLDTDEALRQLRAWFEALRSCGINSNILTPQMY